MMGKIDEKKVSGMSVGTAIVETRLAFVNEEGKEISQHELLAELYNDVKEIKKKLIG